jgi:hypothetical protein
VATTRELDNTLSRLYSDANLQQPTPTQEKVTWLGWLISWLRGETSYGYRTQKECAYFVVVAAKVETLLSKADSTFRKNRQLELVELSEQLFNFRYNELSKLHSRDKVVQEFYGLHGKLGAITSPDKMANMDLRENLGLQYGGGVVFLVDQLFTLQEQEEITNGDQALMGLAREEYTSLVKLESKRLKGKITGYVHHPDNLTHIQKWQKDYGTLALLSVVLKEDLLSKNLDAVEVLQVDGKIAAKFKALHGKPRFGIQDQMKLFGQISKTDLVPLRAEFGDEVVDEALASLFNARELDVLNRGHDVNILGGLKDIRNMCIESELRRLYDMHGVHPVNQVLKAMLGETRFSDLLQKKI